MEHPEKTIFDVARDALQKSQSHSLPSFLQKGLEELEQKAKEKHQADNRTSAVIGTIPPELEDLSRIFDT
ncbi:MAG: hypothetical protein WA987_09925 [Cellvibrio sp.]